MSESKPKVGSWAIAFYFFFVILAFALPANAKGAHAEAWILPVIMLGFGAAGALIGGVIGGVIGLIAYLFDKKILRVAVSAGSVIGFMLIILLWQTLCISRGTAVCLPQ